MKISFLLSILVLTIVSCVNVEIKPAKKVNTPKEKYIYSTCSSAIREIKKIELDTSSWFLNSYWITPIDKTSINLSSKDTLLIHKIKNTKGELYQFIPSKKVITYNGKKIGDIQIDKMKNDSRTMIHLIIYQPDHEFIHGRFSISYLRNERLFLVHERESYKTHVKERVKLIFYKKTNQVQTSK